MVFVDCFVWVGPMLFWLVVVHKFRARIGMLLLLFTIMLFFSFALSINFMFVLGWDEWCVLCRSMFISFVPLPYHSFCQLRLSLVVSLSVTFHIPFVFRHWFFTLSLVLSLTLTTFTSSIFCVLCRSRVFAENVVLRTHILFRVLQS